MVRNALMDVFAIATEGQDQKWKTKSLYTNTDNKQKASFETLNMFFASSKLICNSKSVQVHYLNLVFIRFIEKACFEIS